MDKNLKLVKKIFAAFLVVEENDITEESHIYKDLGVDSIELVQLVLEIETVIGEEISDEDVGEFKVIQDIVIYINRFESKKELNKASCFDCGGTGILGAAFHPIELICDRCGGTGKRDADMRAWARVGKLIREERLGKRKTLWQAASEAKMDATEYSKIERGLVNNLEFPDRLIE